MLYKALASKQESQGFLQNNSRIGYITVENEEAEVSAKSKGWVNHPDTANKLLERVDRRAKLKSFLVANWKFWITTLLAIAALYVAYLGLS